VASGSASRSAAAASLPRKTRTRGKGSPGSPATPAELLVNTTRTETRMVAQTTAYGIAVTVPLPFDQAIQRTRDALASLARD
jgi:hypothetical protein